MATTSSVSPTASARQRSTRTIRLVLWLVAIFGGCAGMLLLEAARPEQYGFMDRAFSVVRRSRWDQETLTLALRVFAGSFVSAIAAVLANLTRDGLRPADARRDVFVLGLFVAGLIGVLVI